MFLITVSSIAHVNLDIILGIAESKTEIFEILWKYTELNLKVYERTYEDDVTYNEINIYKISSEHYAYLTKLYKKYDEVFEDKFSKMNFNSQSFMVYFWYGIYESESNDIDFTKSECKRIKKIIRKSNKLIE